MINLFPTPVYKFSLTGHETYKNKFIKPILKKYRENPASTFDWAANCNSWQVKADDINIDLTDICKEIMQGCKQYLIELEAVGHFKIWGNWFNVHTSDMYQEVHDHVPSFISGTYYLQFDKEKDNPLTFVSDNSSFTNMALAMGIPIKEHKYVKLDVDEGDVLLFPSTLRHMVTKAKEPHTTLRITNSFNIRAFTPQL